MADVSEVNSQLVGAAGHRFEIEESCVVHPLLNPKAGLGVLAVGIDRPEFYVREACDRGFDHAFVIVDKAFDDGGVALFDPFFAELTREGTVSAIGLGGDDQTGRLFIEAVDETGAHHAAAAVFVQVMGQGVEQCAVFVAVGGVDEHVGGLVDDDEVLVFENNIERDVFGPHGVGAGEVEPDLDMVVGTDAVSDVLVAAVHLAEAVANRFAEVHFAQT